MPHRIEHEHPRGCDCRSLLPCPFSGVASMERRLWPDGWNRGDRYSRWHLIPETLDSLRRSWAGWLSVPGVGSVAVLNPTAIPRERTAPLVELTVRIPSEAAHGGRFSIARHRAYSVESATLACAHLSAVAQMHRSAHRGHPVTRMIAAPVLDKRGEAIRRKGGAIVRSETETTPNPASRYVAGLTDSDLAQLIGYARKRAAGRRERHRAREVFERLAEDGVIDLQRDGKLWRIFGPEGDG